VIRRWRASLTLTLAIACATPDGSAGLWDTALWDAEVWARTRPELAGRSGGRLGDATPYLVAADDRLHLFLCRWPLDAPLRTSLPPDANAEERRVLGEVLRAWERAVPGLHFATGEGTAPLRLRFREGGREAAHTAARCRVAPPFDGTDGLDAELVDAEVALRRAEGDAWGRTRTLGPAELAGSAAHEIGHALGLQGHAGSGRSALRRDPAAVRRLGERVLAGEPLLEDAAVALHALHTGVRVAVRALAPGATAGVDAIARRAAAEGRTAAVLQLGDRGLRTAWGPEPELMYYLRDPRELVANELEFEDAMMPSGRRIRR
jgi:hypothetical protein